MSEKKKASPAKALKKVKSGTVKSKIAATQNQIKENNKAAAKMYAGTREIQIHVQNQVKENLEAAAKMYAGTREICSGARAIQLEFKNQMKGNLAYIKDFYG